MVDGFTLVLSCDACEIFLLSLWDAEAIKGIPDLRWYIVPVLALLGNRLDIVIDIVEVNAGEVGTPRWHWTPIVEVQTLETELAHPIWLALHLRDLLNDLLAQSTLGLVRVVFSYVEPGGIIALFQLECLTHASLQFAG